MRKPVGEPKLEVEAATQLSFRLIVQILLTFRAQLVYLTKFGILQAQSHLTKRQLEQGVHGRQQDYGRTVLATSGTDVLPELASRSSIGLCLLGKLQSHVKEPLPLAEPTALQRLDAAGLESKGRRLYEVNKLNGPLFVSEHTVVYDQLIQ